MKTMKDIKGLKTICIVILISLSLIVLYNTSLGRYIYNAFNNFILESQKFYFNSTVLKMNGASYGISNWDGVNPYTLTIDVNNKKNELVSTAVDITYDITYSCPSTVICSVSKTSGVINTITKTDSYTLTVTPIDNFYESDQVVVTTTATSNYPYTKSLSASYTIGVENYGFSYSIIDSPGSKYLTLQLTNSRPYYEVQEAFLTYDVGDHVSLDVYRELSNTNKDKCVSVEVEITFNPNIILLDLTNEYYLNRITNSQTTRIINGYNYVDGFNLKVDANAHNKIIFYKKDISQNYSNNTSILNVSVEN